MEMTHHTIEESKKIKLSAATELLKIRLQENPNMTKEEWKQAKSDFMTYILEVMEQGE